jgi:PD-(D/E)XK nuclease superfamily
MIHEEISGKIIGAAMEMLNELKLRLGEKLYERAMIIELKHRRHSVSVQSSSLFLSPGINWQFRSLSDCRRYRDRRSKSGLMFH